MRRKRGGKMSRTDNGGEESGEERRGRWADGGDRGENEKGND